MRHLTLAVLATLAACTDPDPDPGSEREAATDGGSFWVMWWPEPDPIPVSDEWSLSLMVHDGTDHEQMLMDVDSVVVDAQMPAHGHGMPVAPEVTSEDGVWTASPMQFQMPGDWEIAVIVDRDGVQEQATFQVTCCEDGSGDDMGGMDM